MPLTYIYMLCPKVKYFLIMGHHREFPDYINAFQYPDMQ